MISSDTVRNYSFVYLILIATCFNHITRGLMFDIAQIGPHNHNKDILTDGAGTYISNDGIQLASRSPPSESEDIVGRATYAKLLHLWDTVSGQLANFTTSFTFAISSDGAPDYGDGLSFFLARNSSLVTASGTMGLPVIVNSTNSHMTTSSPFVAVEFDTYWNKEWDPVDASDLPIGDHVGININSLVSLKTAKWVNFTFSKECVVNIEYDSASQNLTVTLMDFHNNTIIPNQFELRYTVDLRRELPEWVVFGFSSSSSKTNFQKNSVKSWYFKSSDLNVDQIRWRKDKKKRRVITYALVSLIAMLICFFVVYVCVYFWNKKPNDEQAGQIGQIVRKDVEVTFESNDLPRAFRYDEMLEATKNFEEGNKLGEGGFGSVYRGVLRNGLDVAVKKVSTTSKQGIKEYKAEVEIISKARHRHLVRLIGWCHDQREGELLVVYELMENRSLDGHLFKSRKPLPWGVRYNIALGLSKALRYLHEECAQCILHRDIKSSNVMLDSEFSPKLGDFGLAKLVDHDKLPDTTILAGTLGYLAPECFSNSKVSRESDVYSYGVVALKIATGRKVIDPNAQDNQRSLINWVRDLYKSDQILQVVDPKLGDEYHQNQMKGLTTLGLWCVHPDPDARPSMSVVLRALNNVDDPLSNLPHEMPSLVQNTPSPHLDEDSHGIAASIMPYYTESNQVSNLNVVGSGWITQAASRYGFHWILHLWHQLDIE